MSGMRPVKGMHPMSGMHALPGLAWDQARPGQAFGTKQAILAPCVAIQAIVGPWYGHAMQTVLAPLWPCKLFFHPYSAPIIDTLMGV